MTKVLLKDEVSITKLLCKVAVQSYDMKSTFWGFRTPLHNEYGIF